jgi:hypothetical protein
MSLRRTAFGAHASRPYFTSFPAGKLFLLTSGPLESRSFATPSALKFLQPVSARSWFSWIWAPMSFFPASQALSAPEKRGPCGAEQTGDSGAYPAVLYPVIPPATLWTFLKPFRFRDACADARAIPGAAPQGNRHIRSQLPVDDDFRRLLQAFSRDPLRS